MKLHERTVQMSYQEWEYYQHLVEKYEFEWGYEPCDAEDAAMAEINRLREKRQLDEGVEELNFD